MTTSTKNNLDRASLLRAARVTALVCTLFGVVLVAPSAGAQYVVKHADVHQASQYKSTSHALMSPGNRASSAIAGQANPCPPQEQRYQGRCAPVRSTPQQARPQPRYTGTLKTTHNGATPEGKPHVLKPTPEVMDRAKVRPQPGAPIEYASSVSGQHGVMGHTGSRAASNADSHGIIFVGGHAQPLQPGVKQSLNPQPIPPGHVARHPAPTGTPINPSGH